MVESPRTLRMFVWWSAAVILIALLVWLGFWIHQARQQQAAIAAIGEIEIEFLVFSVAEGPVNTPVPMRSKVHEPIGFDEHGPAWLRARLGQERCRDWLDTPIEVDLFHSEVADADMRHLRHLPALRSLNLQSTKVSDAGLVCLQGLTRFEELRLASNLITDVGVDHIASLKNLRILDVESAKITDNGLEKLARLPRLQVLGLGVPQVTDAGLNSLKSLQELEVLWLSAGRITTQGLANI